MGPGSYGSQRGRPPKPKAARPPMRPAPKITSTGMTPEMKRKLKEAMKKAEAKAKNAAKKVTKKNLATQKTQKKRKQKYNPYGPGTMNPTKASYGTGP